MEKYSDYSKTLLTELAKNYSDCKFNFKLVNSNVGISVFFVQTKSSIIEENDKWQKISEEIALKYQPRLESVYEKWNLYIIYTITDKSSKDLKSKIENDRFSSRKIVEDDYLYDFNDKEANRLIVKHITNNDLEGVLNETQDKIQEEYEPVNIELWKLVDNDTLLSGNTDLQKLIVDQIIQLKNEN